MTVALIVAVALIGVAAAGLSVWRQSDHRADRAQWARLAATQPTAPARFQATMVQDLPANAQRYFRAVIGEGTPLFTVATLTMQGRLGLGERENPRYLTIEARQILAPPRGFLWQMHTTEGMRISGSDSADWTRFWLLGLVPVARAGGTLDHRRSAFARVLGEAVFWAPAALLPGPGIRWEDTGADTTRVTARHGDLEQSVDITLDGAGRPVQVEMMRWSNANPDKEFRLQPFGGTLSGFREFAGFTLPTQVEAGNFFATEAYFPFFQVQVTDIRFDQPPAP